MTIAHESESGQYIPDNPSSLGHDPRLDRPADEAERQRFHAIQLLGTLSHEGRLIAIRSLYDQLPVETRHSIEAEAAQLYPDDEKRQQEFRLGQATMRHVTRPSEETA